MNLETRARKKAITQTSISFINRSDSANRYTQLPQPCAVQWRGSGSIPSNVSCFQRYVINIHLLII